MLMYSNDSSFPKHLGVGESKQRKETKKSHGVYLPPDNRIRLYYVQRQLILAQDGRMVG